MKKRKTYKNPKTPPAPSSVAKLLKTYRKKYNLSQKKVGEKLGLSVCQNGQSSYVKCEWGRVLPSIPTIYKLSQVFPDIDKDVLFNAVLREHHEKFTYYYYEIYARWQREGDKVLTKKFAKQLMWTKGRKKKNKIKHNFKEFSSILQKAAKRKNIPYGQKVKHFNNWSGAKSNRKYGDIIKVINGQKPASLLVLIDLANYFELDSFELFKVFVKEKAMAHAKNMMMEWQSYKKEKENETEVVEAEKAYV